MMFLLSNSQLKLGTFFKSWHCDNQWQLANTCFDEENSNGHMAIGSASEAMTFGRTEIQKWSIVNQITKIKPKIYVLFWIIKNQ